jgi:hypothetical protein
LTDYEYREEFYALVNRGARDGLVVKELAAPMLVSLAQLCVQGANGNRQALEEVVEIMRDQLDHCVANVR